jgi:hypothetical protein
LPTALPRARQAARTRSRAQKIFDFVFNGALIVSALALTVIVLVREEDNALGRRPQTLVQAAQQDLANLIGDDKSVPPSN